METDRRVVRHYELGIEAERLWRRGVGDLVRLRTWDIFERLLPPAGRIADVGGGPGTHAKHSLDCGYEVVLVDPVRRLIEQAVDATGGRARCVLGDARRLALDDESFDAVLLMGPLYHLPDPHDRLEALGEAARIATALAASCGLRAPDSASRDRRCRRPLYHEQLRRLRQGDR